MKAIKTLMFLLICGGMLQAQPFSANRIYQMPQPDSIRITWGDMNGDGLLDLVAFSQKENRTESFVLIQKDSINFIHHALSLDSNSQLNFQLKDFDHDGRLDIIYIKQSEESKLVVAYNRGGLTFELTELDFVMDEFLIHDIDWDGDEDIIASRAAKSGDDAIYWIKSDSSFLAKNSISAISLVSSDYHINSQDIWIPAKNSAGDFNLIQLAVENDSLVYLPIFDLPEIQTWDQGDLNHDGNVDFVFRSADQYLIYYWNGEHFELDTLAVNVETETGLFTGDIDLDGLTDVLSYSINPTHAQAVFYKNNGSGDFLADSLFLVQNDGFLNIPADINDDGDLDVLSLIHESDSLIIFVQLNQTTISNQGPAPVSIRAPRTVYDQTFFSWRTTTDDHTDSLAISYELFIQNAATQYYTTIPGYDINSGNRQGFRKVVGHGYQWFDRHYTAKSLENGRYFWGVVGVDNAYFASADIRDCNGNSPCIDYFTVLNCFDLIVEDTAVCANSVITIDLERGQDSITWYSVKQGFLEISPVLSFRALESDTIYAMHYPKVPCGETSDLCGLNFSLAIHVETRAQDLLGEIQVCPESDNLIAVEGVWDSVRWWYDNVIVARGPEIVLDSIPQIPIIVECFDSIKCSAIDTLVLKKTTRTFDSGSIQRDVFACESEATEVIVFDGVDTENLRFSWSPGQLFDDPSLSNPVITVSQPIQIFVIITESNCFVDTLELNIEIGDIPIVTTNGDQEIFRGEKALLEADGASSYSWVPPDALQSPKAQNTWAEPVVTTTYLVKGTNDVGCHGDASLTIFVKKSVYIPDIFSPNGDGHNDLLHVYGEGIVRISFKIFDERGSLLAELDETSNAKGWDGSTAGNELPSGTYFWTVAGEFSDGQAISYQGKNKGTVRLVR